MYSVWFMDTIHQVQVVFVTPGENENITILH